MAEDLTIPGTDQKKSNTNPSFLRLKHYCMAKQILLPTWQMLLQHLKSSLTGFGLVSTWLKMMNLSWGRFQGR